MKIRTLRAGKTAPKDREDTIYEVLTARYRSRGRVKRGLAAHPKGHPPRSRYGRDKEHRNRGIPQQTLWPIDHAVGPRRRLAIAPRIEDRRTGMAAILAFEPVSSFEGSAYLFERWPAAAPSTLSGSWPNRLSRSRGMAASHQTREPSCISAFEAREASSAPCGQSRAEPNVSSVNLVRSRRLELPRVAPLPPQGSASTNSATTASWPEAPHITNPRRRNKRHLGEPAN